MVLRDGVPVFCTKSVRETYQLLVVLAENKDVFFEPPKDYTAQVKLVSSKKAQRELGGGFSFGTAGSGTAGGGANGASNGSGDGGKNSDNNSSSGISPAEGSGNNSSLSNDSCSENTTFSENTTDENTGQSGQSALEEERSKTILRCRNPSLEMVGAMLSVINGVTAKAAQRICEEILVLPRALDGWQRLSRNREERLRREREAEAARNGEHGADNIHENYSLFTTTGGKKLRKKTSKSSSSSSTRNKKKYPQFSHPSSQPEVTADKSSKSCTCTKRYRPELTPHAHGDLGSHLGCVPFPYVHDLLLLADSIPLEYLEVFMDSNEFSISDLVTALNRVDVLDVLTTETGILNRPAARLVIKTIVGDHAKSLRREELLHEVATTSGITRRQAERIVGRYSDEKSILKAEVEHKHITEVVRTKRTKDLLVNKLMGAGGRRM